MIYNQERTPRRAFTYSKSNTLKLTVKTPERLSIEFIVNFGHIFYLFLVFLLLALNNEIFAGSHPIIL